MTKLQTLKQLRKAAGLSKYALAKLSGVSAMTIMRAENAGSWPKHGTVRRALEAALGVKP
jgi:transcriptional regulator with XRE-family HTH domain